MGAESTRVDGSAETAAFFVMTMVAVVFWYGSDFSLNGVVLAVGAVVGVGVYLAHEIPDEHPIAAFPVTIVVVVAMSAALLIESLVAGVVAALTVTTVLKAYDVFA